MQDANHDRCRNVLTFNRLIPPEVLSIIFGEVVQCPERQDTGSCDFLDSGHIGWIRSVSHVCSHWREVALATPNLWSDIPINNPPWAQEMVRRSYPVPLTIRYQGQMSAANSEQCTRLYKTLTGILRFHLPRIKCLTLDSWLRSRSIYFDEYEGDSSESILSLLNQPAPMIERLEVRLGRSEKNKLPYELFTMSSRLRHLTLEDCGMAWDPELIDFGNLRSLVLSNLPQQTNPSLYQLLALLRQTPRLESLILKKRDQATDLGDSSMLHGIDPITLRHLEQIKLTGGLSYCVLLNHLVFSQNACSIKLDIQGLPEISGPLAHSLAQKFDSCIEGSNLSLRLSHYSILCWKSKDTPQILPFHDPPTIIINYYIRLVDPESLWRLLNLNQLISLEIDDCLDQDSWTFLGNLPRLQYILLRSFQRELFSTLQHGLVEESTADAQPVHMTFPALRDLTMFRCSLNRAAFSPVSNVVQLMISCFELRKKAGLRLNFLRLEECTGVDGVQLEPLRGIINHVQCIEEPWYFGADVSDVYETDEDWF